MHMRVYDVLVRAENLHDSFTNILLFVAVAYILNFHMFFDRLSEHSSYRAGHVEEIVFPY
jgi:hypothetical protein